MTKSSLNLTSSLFSNVPPVHRWYTGARRVDCVSLPIWARVGCRSEVHGGGEHCCCCCWRWWWRWWCWCDASMVHVPHKPQCHLTGDARVMLITGMSLLSCGHSVRWPHTTVSDGVDPPPSAPGWLQWWAGPRLPASDGLDTRHSEHTQPAPFSPPPPPTVWKTKRCRCDVLPSCGHNGVDEGGWWWWWWRGKGRGARRSALTVESNRLLGSTAASTLARFLFSLRDALPPSPRPPPLLSSPPPCVRSSAPCVTPFPLGGRRRRKGGSPRRFALVGFLSFFRGVGVDCLRTSPSFIVLCRTPSGSRRLPRWRGGRDHRVRARSSARARAVGASGGKRKLRRRSLAR